MSVLGWSHDPLLINKTGFKKVLKLQGWQNKQIRGVFQDMIEPCKKPQAAYLFVSKQMSLVYFTLLGSLLSATQAILTCKHTKSKLYPTMEGLRHYAIQNIVSSPTPAASPGSPTPDL